MELSRRDSLKLSGAGAGGLLLYTVLKRDKALASPKRFSLKKKVEERTTICPYCGVGCGAIMVVESRKTVNIEVTNRWINLGNSDCIMAIAGNPAETSPNAFNWITRAKEKGAKLIHVDCASPTPQPRLTFMPGSELAPTLPLLAG